MNHIWKPKGNCSEKLILIENACIYKGELPSEYLNVTPSENIRPEALKKLFGIPFSYITRVVIQEGVQHLQITYGTNSMENFKIENLAMRREIFNVLKEYLSKFDYRSETPTTFNYAKPQFFSLIFITILFIWIMYLAIQISNGFEYEGLGGNGNITGLILGLAHFGISKIAIAYLIILSIIGISLKNRLKTRSELELLERRK